MPVGLPKGVSGLLSIRGGGNEYTWLLRTHPAVTPNAVHLLAFMPLYNPSPWVGGGSVTCFLSTKHSKGDRMSPSLSWLCYAVRFHLGRLELETPLADFEGVSRCCVVRGHVARNCGQPLANSQHEAWTWGILQQGNESANNLREHRSTVLSQSSLWWDHRPSQHW